MITKENHATKKELSRLYDEIYNDADALFKQYNPCNIKIDKQKNITCYYYPKNHNSLCCGSCKYHSKAGCTVRNLACKLFICYYNNNNNKEFEEKIELLRNKAIKIGFRLNFFFHNKEASINIAIKDMKERGVY